MMRAAALPRTGKLLAVLALAALLMLIAAGVQAAVPASWKGTGLAINAGGMTLRAVLEEFSRVYGVRLVLDVPGQRLMTGRLAAASGSEFLNRLAPACQCSWFVYSDTLYIVPASDHSSVRLQLGEDAVQDAKAALVGVGLFDERFGWGELPDVGTVIVSGPRRYVKLAREILLPDAREAKARGRRVMVFKLKYASAMDRTINARGQSETIPGVKTILSGLLLGPNTGEKLAETSQFDIAASKRSRQSKVGQGEAQELPRGSPFVPIFSPPTNGKGELPPRSPRAEGEGRKAAPAAEPGKLRIEASAAMNAILIYDDVQQREMYAALIAELDVPPQQIEIEALIIDMDRSNLSDMGVEWGVRAGAVDAVFNSTKSDSGGTQLPLPGATLLISNVNRFYARLKALEAKGEARVLATPTVLTLDNVAAVLDLSQTAYVPLVGERVADLADVTAGTQLRVIPRIIREPDGAKVHLEVDIEDGSLDSAGNSGTTKDARSNVRVTRSTISTQAIVDLQQTLMIGGYRAERMSTDKQKTPLLGDLPLVGGMFRSESESRSTRERLFLITPRLSGPDRSRTEPVSGKGRKPKAPAEPVQQAAVVAPPPAKPAAPAQQMSPGPVAVPRLPAQASAAATSSSKPSLPNTATATERAPWALIPAAVSSRQLEQH
ncbi:type III secretion system outer membrane ring subunit SctC [Massilia sp. MB5]|uniref:type III secretion system outer membrane ring subunit SctC n=1 Tax=Massilia sp. MB5 TaxID=2919578 RepID=UPI001F1103D1|nr:type III secretion system outer membrane ring subunit SctC [Massilia sp. MB5]UMR32268.1 type III secretion system outer membrane ring subunit SctC [Massilia sp. MB5]